MEKHIETIEGMFTLREHCGDDGNSHIEIVDDCGLTFGNFKGSLDDYTDEELRDIVENNLIF